MDSSTGPSPKLNDPADRQLLPRFRLERLVNPHYDHIPPSIPGFEADEEDQSTGAWMRGDPEARRMRR